MAKKIVRGITDVKTINNQDFDTNNVNDLLSDGQYNYIHRKKGKTEEYHNLTDNIKTLSSDNTELLSVTNYNKTTNTATLHPKHDAQKEQVIESTRDTITINHGENGTDEKTSVDVNFDKVQAKLTTGDGLSISNNKISIKPTPDGNPLNNGFYMGNVINDNTSSSIISLESEDNRIVQLCFRESAVSPNLMIMRYRFVNNNVATDWKLATIDNDQLLSLLARKEQVLESTRKTIAINRGEKTTVDTNPQKVLEHENLISDSEYITLDHQTDVNKTHIKTESLKQELQQLHQTKQDTLVAGDGITIEGQTISATAGGAPVEGATSAFKFFIQQDEGVFFEVYKHTITQPYTTGATSGRLTFTTYTFDGEGAEIVLTGELKEELEPHFNNNISISNGGLSITYDGTNIKLINSKPTEDDVQQATFTFLRFIPDGGGDIPV